MPSTLDFGLNIGKEEQEVFHDKLRYFVKGHESMLLGIQQTFDRRWDPMMWDPHTDTVCLQLGSHGPQPRELTVSLADTLGRTKLHNRPFFRITLCFASLVTEMESLTHEGLELLIPPLATFGDENCREEGIGDEEAQQGAGRLLKTLQTVWNWVQRVYKVVLQVVRQLAALYSPIHQQDIYKPFTHVRFPLVWQTLTNLLAALISIEEVLQSHDTLRQGFLIYRKLLAHAAKNQERFEYDKMTMELFCRLLDKIEQELLDDGILQRLVMQTFDAPDELSLTTVNDRFQEEFTDLLVQMTASVEECVGTTREGDARRRYIGILGMYYLYIHLFHQNVKENRSRELCKRIFSLQRLVPVIYLRGIHTLCPAAWLTRRIPAELTHISRDPLRDGMQAIKRACQQSAEEFIPQLSRLTTLVSAWLAEMETAVSVHPEHYRTLLQVTTNLLQRGVLLAQHLQRLIINHVTLHNCADASISLQHVDGIAHGLQLLMMIRSAYHTKSGVIAAMFNLLVRSITYVMERHLYDIYQRLSDAIQSSTEEVTDQYSAVGEAITLLHKQQTQENIICLDLVLSTALNRRRGSISTPEIITEKDSEDILIAFSQLKCVLSYQQSVRVATNCDFLYWQRETFFPIFFERIYQRPLLSEHLSYLVMAMHDCRPSILSSQHVDNATKLLDEYIAYIRSCFHKKIIDPLCTDIENDLRLYTHSVILGQPFRRIESVGGRDYALFTRLGPFRFFNEWMHIASEVENYLDAQFYNLNALMANDWKTYEEMRNLALKRYGLHICDGYLPGSIVDQGLDVLVITENIQVFVANYTYNMNEQLFVQRPSKTESKHLHTLHIRHIANSIRTHGTGIMNTTVNYVYKCILKKLAILSQFLYDDHVKSRLIKDLKQFLAQKIELKGEYPLSQAEKFIREMRKLGVTDDGQMFLEKFRHLVSEIGNALGYMRMMRSGGLHAIADSAAFIPSIDNVVRLEKVIDPKAIGSDDDEEVDDENGSMWEKDAEDSNEDEGVAKAPLSTVEAMRMVDRVVDNMRKKLSDGSEYFRMLLEAVTKRLKAVDKYNHLKNFYMIIPPICVLHVELMIREKEQLIKKNKDGLFTDDGFALGCSFLLRLFGVVEQFESLHWFDSVRKHYAARHQAMLNGIAERNKEANKHKKPKQNTANEDEEINNMHLTATMVDYAICEYAALDEAFVSSKVFFHCAIQEEDEEEEEDEGN